MKINVVDLWARDHQGTMNRRKCLWISQVKSLDIDDLYSWDRDAFRSALKYIGVKHVGGGAALDCGVPFKVVATSSTLATIAGIKTPANQAAQMYGFNIGFDGTTSTNGPALIDIGTCTFATNAPGTNSTSVTPVAYDSGRPETPQSTAGKAWTAQPTVISIVESFPIPSYMGTGIIFYPLAHPLTGKGGNGMIMNVTQQTGITPNGTGALRFTE